MMNPRLATRARLGCVVTMFLLLALHSMPVLADLMSPKPVIVSGTVPDEAI